ncbi:MAG: deoxyribodipyrimidine photo-lyase [Candidatus Sumerlaeota bacterium]
MTGKAGSRLVIREGQSLETLNSLIEETGAEAIFWNRLYDPTTIPRDSKMKAALQQKGIEVRSFAGALLHEPHAILNKSKKPFLVFTPYWNHVAGLDDPPVPTPMPNIPPLKNAPKSLAINDLELLPKIHWDKGIAAAWEPGETGGQKVLQHFLNSAMSEYPADRNRPDHEGTSRLSPYLHFGEVTPRMIWHAVKMHMRNSDSSTTREAGWSYLRQIVWREFAHYLLFHEPQTADQPLREDFKKFPWKKNAKLFRPWQRGETGYPLVDAGMRQLWETGWMHNRVRMVVASFLVKHLLIDWREGARWFWDTLVDADLANNTMGWQWVAGCGADAAPYFRIFNPTTQAEKFDPNGEYIRKWVPEIAKLPLKALYSPADAADLDLSAAGVVLGKTYPRPIIDHREARERALDVFASLKKNL